MEVFTYQTSPLVCSEKIEIGIENGIVKKAVFSGGCHGNLQGISRLVKDRSVSEVISLLKGIHCNGKTTSCPDQLATALEQFNNGDFKVR